MSFDAFNATWMIGLTLFGLHLMVVAWILWRSLLAPRWLAALVALAGVVYLADTTAYTLLVDYESVAGVMTAIVIGPAVLGELCLTVWLLRYGRSEHGMGRRRAPQLAG